MNEDDLMDYEDRLAEEAEREAEEERMTPEGYYE